MRRTVRLLRRTFPRLQVKEFAGMNHGSLGLIHPELLADEIAAVVAASGRADGSRLQTTHVG